MASDGQMDLGKFVRDTRENMLLSTNSDLGLGDFTGLEPFPKYKTHLKGGFAELPAGWVDPKYHPSTDLGGRYRSSLRWNHSIVKRYPASFLEDYRPGFVINIEAMPSKLVEDGSVSQNKWCITYALSSWMCSTLQYAVFPPKFEHPLLGAKSVRFPDLIQNKKFRKVAEDVLMSDAYKFPVLPMANSQSPHAWGEYVVVAARTLSIGPSKEIYCFFVIFC
jgi:hypothetical protein